jgi:hypothetical protein
VSYAANQIRAERAEQELALANTLAELRHLQVLQLKPSPASKRDLLSQMKRSARAEIRLRLKDILLTKQKSR